MAWLSTHDKKMRKKKLQRLRNYNELLGAWRWLRDCAGATRWRFFFPFGWRAVQQGKHATKSDDIDSPLWSERGRWGTTRRRSIPAPTVKPLQMLWHYDSSRNCFLYIPYTDFSTRCSAEEAAASGPPSRPFRGHPASAGFFSFLMKSEGIFCAISNLFHFFFRLIRPVSVDRSRCNWSNKFNQFGSAREIAIRPFWRGRLCWRNCISSFCMTLTTGRAHQRRLWSNLIMCPRCWTSCSSTMTTACDPTSEVKPENTVKQVWKRIV